MAPRTRTAGRCAARALAAAVSALLVPLAFAQGPAGETRPPLPEKETLRGIETEIEKSGFEQRRLTFEIENLSTEAQSLRANLIETARKLREAEDKAATEEEKLAGLVKQEAALRRSLQSRERVLAEVLAAMQRIGRKPPPALLVAPEDVLSAMRAAILLGAVLPDMRDEAMILVADLKTLSDLRRQNQAVTEALRQERDRIAGERGRLASLVEARQGQISLSKEQLEQERQRVAALARDARSLRDLIARSENEIVGNARAAEIARRAPAPARSGTQLAALRPEAARLQPRQPFQDRRGQLPLPVSGALARLFGQSDGMGGVERGVTISSNPGAVVTAPADGWVHFAGAYRGYGHLLIINAGGGYHIVLAGMERLSIETGQFVLAGEPVGFLGGAAPSNPGVPAPTALGGARPALYVEFRKEGSPVDPSPWWSLNIAEKARG
ncbi:MAG: peptidoglycan DD-metalloendopeptidase family protein [Proteobacteria bacterium]|nr:peptidoglycan DD-metalloendopeptidase family protein [Pseudomonadota bacterium]